MENQSQELKAVLKEMFAWFHGFCQAHQLRYYMLGGTMLGAVRHGGFIPWDDDVDVGMPREDLRRLRQLMREESQTRYVLETPDDANADFFYPYGKLYDTRTTLTENTRVPVKRGVYLDIFPLDGAGDTKEEAIAFFRPIKRRLALLLTVTTGIRAGRKFYKNAAVVLLRAVPRWIIDPRKLLLDIQRRCGEKPFSRCDWIANFCGAYWEREIMPRAVFGEPKEYAFEDMTAYGVSDPETYLTLLYGDWRALPPEDKRKSHHDNVCCDLHRSYLEE